jgi:hypothetical protein
MPRRFSKKGNAAAAAHPAAPPPKLSLDGVDTEDRRRKAQLISQRYLRTDVAGAAAGAAAPADSGPSFAPVLNAVSPAVAAPAASSSALSSAEPEQETPAQRLQKGLKASERARRNKKVVRKNETERLKDDFQQQQALYAELTAQQQRPIGHSDNRTKAQLATLYDLAFQNVAVYKVEHQQTDDAKSTNMLRELQRQLRASNNNVRTICQRLLLREVAYWCWMRYLDGVKLAAKEIHPSWQEDALAPEVAAALRFVFFLDGKTFRLFPSEDMKDRVIDIVLFQYGGQVYFAVMPFMPASHADAAHHTWFYHHMLNQAALELTPDGWLCDVHGDASNPPLPQEKYVRVPLVRDCPPECGIVEWWRSQQVLPLTLAIMDVTSAADLVRVTGTLRNLKRMYRNVMTKWNNMISGWALAKSGTALYLQENPSRFETLQDPRDIIPGYHLLPEEQQYSRQMELEEERRDLEKEKKRQAGQEVEQEEEEVAEVLGLY